MLFLKEFSSTSSWRFLINCVWVFKLCLGQAYIPPLEFVGSERISVFKSLSKILLSSYFHINLLISCVTSKQDTSGPGQVDMWRSLWFVSKYREFLKFCWYKWAKETHQIFGLWTFKLMPSIYLID
jgi:hypothetical protein